MMISDFSHSFVFKNTLHTSSLGTYQDVTNVWVDLIQFIWSCRVVLGLGKCKCFLLKSQGLDNDDFGFLTLLCFQNTFHTSSLGTYEDVTNVWVNLIQFIWSCGVVGAKQKGKFRVIFSCFYNDCCIGRLFKNTSHTSGAAIIQQMEHHSLLPIVPNMCRSVPE